MYSKIAVSASVLAAASVVSAQVGSSIIKNQCSNDVYLWFVTNTPGEMVTIPAGGSYSNGYQTNPDGGGISIKLATEPNGAITQFEYTLGTGQYADLFYDISNINGYPFLNSGLSLIPSDPSCRSVLCPAGIVCTLAYNQPDDNEATASCGIGSDMTLLLCSEGSSDTSSSSSSNNNLPAANEVSSSSSAAPTATYVAPPPSSTSTYVAPPPSTTSTYVAPPPSTTSTYVAPPPSTTSTYVAPPPSSTSSTYVAPPPSSTSVVGYVATTFTTQVVTVTAAPSPEDESDWSFYHHPASLGAFWSPNRREEAEAEHHHKRAAHRHHFQRRAEEVPN